MAILIVGDGGATVNPTTRSLRLVPRFLDAVVILSWKRRDRGPDDLDALL